MPRSVRGRDDMKKILTKRKIAVLHADSNGNVFEMQITDTEKVDTIWLMLIADKNFMAWQDYAVNAIKNSDSKAIEESFSWNDRKVVVLSRNPKTTKGIMLMTKLAIEKWEKEMKGLN